MQSSNKEVLDFIGALNHPLESLILEWRKLILNLDKELHENLKWNAPNYSYRNEDRFTFNFPPRKDQVRLILHFGARKKFNAKSKFTLESSTFFKWLADDRAMLTFNELNTFFQHKAEIETILNHWLSLGLNDS